MPRPIRTSALLLPLLSLGLVSCSGPPARETSGPVPLQPIVVTEAVPGDSDDPAIWIHPTDPDSSIVFGTDKEDVAGGVYAFRLDGSIDRQRSLTPLQRPNNADVQDGFELGGAQVSILAATERHRMALRLFIVPDMRAVDGGGIEVFGGDTARAPMGVALYRRPTDGAVFAIVGGKGGPTEGYLAQYRLEDDGSGSVRATLEREFGTFSGSKEIEAIAVDDALGWVYYSDEGVGIRKYDADPASDGRELALFGTEGFAEDHEGIGIFPRPDGTGYLLISNQQAGSVAVFPREGAGGNPHDHPLLVDIPVSALETDGLEVVATPLGSRFPRGAVILMSTDRTFHFYRWEDFEERIPR